MEKKYVLAIDQSTQGTKAILFDKKGNLKYREDIPHKQHINENGWISHDLNEIYDNTLKVVKKVIERSGIRKEEIACLGISNQRETSAAWNKETGRPLAQAIVWQCSRAEAICERIRNCMIAEKQDEQGNILNASAIIADKTGMPLSPYFPASKYAWLLENEEQVKSAKNDETLAFGTIDSWLLFKLTNGMVHATDYSNASRTQLFNINTLKWDEEICSWFGIPLISLPEVKDSNSRFGVTDFDGYFDEPIEICSMIGDSQAALFGQGCVQKGMIKATYGTGSSVMMNVGNEPLKSQNGLVTSIGWGINDRVTYVLEGNINYTGAVITWLKDDVGLIEAPSDTQRLAEEANQSDNTYLVPAFSGLGAPYWKPNARAVLYGMSRTTGKKEIVKAALESIAYQITDIVESMKSEEDIQVKELCVDGGPTKNQYLMSFQSDILQTSVKMPRCEESSALGAAMLAGLSSGFYKPDNLFNNEDRVIYVPSMSSQDRNDKYRGWKETIDVILR